MDISETVNQKRKQFDWRHPPAWLQAALIVLVAFLAVRTYATAPGLPEDQGLYDTSVHAYRLWQTNEVLTKYGGLPLWTSDWYGGMPFLELYPPLSEAVFAWLPSLFSPESSIRIALALTHILGALFFFLLTRRIFRNEAKLALGASLIFVLFPYGLFQVFPRGALAEGTLLMLAPLVFLAYERLREAPTLKNQAVLGIAMGLALLAHFVVGGVLLLAVAGLALVDRYEKKGASLGAVAAPLLAGVLVLSFFIVSTLELLPQTVIGTAQRPSFAPLLLNEFAAKISANPSYVGWLGILALLAALPSMVKDEHGLRKYVAVCAVLLVGGLGGYALAPTFLLNALQFGFRLFSIFAVVFSLLIPVGLARIADEISARVPSDWQPKISNRQVSGVVFALLVLALLIDYQAYQPTGAAKDVPDFLKRFYTRIASDPSFFRVDDLLYFGFGASPVWHHHAAVVGGFGEASASYAHEFYARAYQTIKGEGNLLGKENAFTLFGTESVRYLLFNVPVYFHNLRSLECGKGYCIYENLKFQPYARLVPQVNSAAGEKADIYPQAAQDALDGKLDLENEPLVVWNQELPAYYGENTSTIRILSQRPGYLKVRVLGISSDNGAYLVVSESYFSRWKAYLNGQPVAVYGGVPSLLVVPVHNGEVVLRYELSGSAQIAAAVSVLAFAALLAAYGIGWLFKK